MSAQKARLVPQDAIGSRPVSLRPGRTTVGRGPNNTLVLRDPEVSKEHAEIVMEGARYVLNDLGSSNGTFVNNRAVRQHELAPGDRVEFGTSTYTFELGPEPAAVTILAGGPIDRTQVLAATKMEALVPAAKISTPADLRGMYDRVRTAFEAVQELVTTTDTAALCEKILDVTFELLGAETGAVLLYEDTDQLAPLAFRSTRPDADGTTISSTIIDHAVRDRSAVLANDALTDQRFSDAKSIVMSGMRSLMCVPIISDDKIFGIIHVGASQTSAFEAPDLELMGGIGVGAGVALTNAFLAQRLATEAKSRESLSRFFSPNLVEQVLGDKLNLKRGGDARYVTVLFSDIRGFTSLTERSKAGDIVRLLNQYFDPMVEIVFEHGGTLDKFIGDAIMAVWGSPVSKRDDAKRAVTCAKQMQVTLKSLNEYRADQGQEPIEIGIGLASGDCVAGAIGARRRLEYTVIGDAVNLASRLSGSAQPGQILVDDETFKRAKKPKATKLPPLDVKGKDKPVTVYAVKVEG